MLTNAADLADRTHALNSPAKVRALILKEHASLRRRLAQLAALVQLEQLPGHPNAVDELRREFYAVADFFVAHLALEDELLPPLLRDDYAWGEDRAKAMNEHHREQRRELELLRRTFDAPSVNRAEIFAALEAFVAELEIDMRHEESGLLSAAVLGDDIVSVEASG